MLTLTQSGLEWSTWPSIGDGPRRMRMFLVGKMISDCSRWNGWNGASTRTGVHSSQIRMMRTRMFKSGATRARIFRWGRLASLAIWSDERGVGWCFKRPVEPQRIPLELLRAYLYE